MTTNGPNPSDHDHGERQQSRPPPVRRVWQGVALACVGLGGLGVVLPLLPTTPFLLLAAWAASRSSPNLHQWLHDHPRFGRMLRDWRDHRALRRRAKTLALLLIAASWAIVMMTVQTTAPRVLATLVMLAVAVFLATRPAHPEER